MPRKAKASTTPSGGMKVRGMIDKRTRAKFKNKEQPFSAQGRAAQLRGLKAENKRILDELDKM